MNLPDLAMGLCEQLGALGFSESKNAATLESVVGTLRIAYRQGETNSKAWSKDVPKVAGWYWQKFPDEKPKIINVDCPPCFKGARCEWCGPIVEPKTL